MTTAPVSLPELKAHLNLTTGTSASDTELQLHLDAATEAIEKRIGPILQREVTERATVGRRGVLVLSTLPVVSVTTVTEVVAGRSWDVTTLHADPSGVVGLVSRGYLPPVGFDVTYTAGRAATTDDVPARFKLAILIVAEQLWETQRGSGARPAMFGMAAEASSTSAHDAQFVYRGFALPKRALELISGDEQIAFA